MTEEIKIEEEKKCNCFCHSKGFKKFVVVAAGTFVGVYLALSLFAAIHKPPMPAPAPAPMPCPCQQQMLRPDFGPQPGFAPQRADRGPRPDFGKKGDRHQANRPMPPRADRPAPAPEVNR